MCARNTTWQVTESFQLEDVVNTQSSIWRMHSNILRLLNILQPSVASLSTTSAQTPHVYLCGRLVPGGSTHAIVPVWIHRRVGCSDAHQAEIACVCICNLCASTSRPDMLAPKPMTTPTTIATKYPNRSGPAGGEGVSCMCFASFGTSEYLHRARLRIPHDLTVIATADQCSVDVASTI